MATANKYSEIVLLNKVILETLDNIINMLLRSRSYKFWTGTIKKYCTKTFHLFLYDG